MDLIGQLATTLGVDPKMAEAVAGQVLGMARDQAGDEETAKLDEAVPELQGWQATAQQVMASGEGGGGGGLFGSLAEMASTGLGKELVGAVLGEEAEDTAVLVGLMNKLGLKAEHATMAAPVVKDFLEERIGSEWMDRLLQAAPLLSSFFSKG